MRKKHTFLVQIACILFVLLVVLLPWHDTLITIVLDGFGLRSVGLVAQILPAYKEFLLLLLVLIAGGFWWKDKGWRQQQWPLYILLYGVIMLTVTLPGVVSGDVSWSQLLFGARTEFGFAAALFAGGILLPYFKDSQVRAIIVSGGISFIAALLWAFGLQIIGHESLVHLGFSDTFSSYAEGQAPSYCQKEAHTNFCRMQGPFAGPNRWAAYLLTVLPLVCFTVAKVWMRNLLIFLGVLAIGLTLSSGAYLALLVVLLFVLIWRYQPNLFKEVWLYGIVFVAGVAGYFLAERYLLESSLHVKKLVEGIILFFDQPLGQGIGAAGPAAIKAGLESVPESWFVQVLINGGILGFVVFLFVIVASVWRHLKRLPQATWRFLNSYSAVFVLVTIMLLVHNVFLHTLEVPAAYVLWGVLFGLAERDL